MLNPDETVEDAWVRSRGRCECDEGPHGHRCVSPLEWGLRGSPRTGGWQAFFTGTSNMTGWDAVRHCMILCWNCYARKGRAVAA